MRVAHLFVLPEHTRLGVRPNCAVFRLVVAWFESVLRDLRTAPGPIGDVGTSAPPAVPAASNISPRIGWISEEPRRREQTREIDPSRSASTGCDHNSRTVSELKDCRQIANFVFDSRRLHHPSLTLGTCFVLPDVSRVHRPLFCSSLTFCAVLELRWPRSKDFLVVRKPRSKPDQVSAAAACDNAHGGVDQNANRTSTCLCLSAGIGAGSISGQPVTMQSVHCGILSV